jgi:hypothetical protein
MVNSPPNLLTRTENSKDFARQGHLGKMSDRVLWGENLEVEAVHSGYLMLSSRLFGMQIKL